MMYKLGWFTTGRDKAARDLLAAVQNSIRQGEIKAEIAFVFCSREPGESAESDLFLEKVANYDIPAICFSYQKFKSARGAALKSETLPQWRLDYDREVMSRLKDSKPDLCVLAGYMLIVGSEMCQKYNMINLHPAAPGGPTGTWQEVIWQLIKTEADETGVTMHLVTPELDRGPAVAYGTFPIKGKPFAEYWDEIKGLSIEQIKQEQGKNNRLFQLIREQGFRRELPLIIATIKAFSQGNIKITAAKRVVDAEDRPIYGYNLTKEINEVVKSMLS
jgi:folate-dependent phosphoribosylglycinamide formyltransferase PurN